MASRRRLGRLAVTVVATLSLIAGGIWLWRATAVADCTVTSGDRTVDLTTDQAERATRGQSVDLDSEDLALVKRAVSGRLPHSLSCEHTRAWSSASRKLNGRGLTSRADAVRRSLGADFDGIVFGGYQPGGVTTGHMEGSAHYEGRAIDLFFRPVNKRQLRKGWAVAHYLVAHSERLRIETVIYDRKIWTRQQSPNGWREYRLDVRGKPAATRAILLHRDHVHVDVAD